MNLQPPAEPRPAAPDKLPAGAPSDPPLPSIHSHELLRGSHELIIHHAGEIYRLRVTRNGKLILNK